MSVEEAADHYDDDGNGSDIADEEVDGFQEPGFDGEGAAVGDFIEEVGAFHTPADKDYY